MDLSAERDCGLAAAVALAEGAGALLMERFGRLAADEVGSKSDRRDLVTAADLASERFLLDGLREAFPDDDVLAEESGVHDRGAAARWYVDPLDGTVNFVHGLPMFAVSLARVRDGRPELAVVHLPRLGETFRAAAGGGAWLGGRRLAVSASAEPRESIFATGFPYRRDELADNNLENFDRMFLHQRGVRRMGSAAVDLAYVAAGRIDAFWELHLSPWDVAGGALLVQEAGGVVDTLVPGGDWLHGRNLIAGPAELVARTRALLLAGRGADYPDLGDRRP